MMMTMMMRVTVLMMMVVHDDDVDAETMSSTNNSDTIVDPGAGTVLAHTHGTNFIAKDLFGRFARGEANKV